MRMPISFVAALFIAVPIFADDKKVDADLKAMIGKWVVEKAELGGKDITEQFQTLKFNIDADGKYTSDLGQVKDTGVFTVDPSKTPKEMDIKPTAGFAKGKTVKCIYKIDGDKLTVCYDFDVEKGKRPEKFESKADTLTLLVTYKREKK